MSNKIYSWINSNGILTSIIGSIIFVLLTLIFTREKRILTYKEIVHQELFNPNENPDFTFITPDSIKLIYNVYFVELDIWNQGNTPITEDDIKEELTINLDSNAIIISNPKVIQTHDKVTQAKIALDTSSIKLGFAFLEKGNAIKLKFYYYSKTDKKSEIKLKGYFIGGSSIKNFNETLLRKSNFILYFLYYLLPGLVFGWYFGSKLPVPLVKTENKYLLNLIFIGTVLLFLITIFVLTKLVGFILDNILNYFNGDSPF